MAETDLSRLRAAALMLPETERAALAHALVKSLDAPADSDIAQAWEEELLRRLNEIDCKRGFDPTLPWVLACG